MGVVSREGDSEVLATDCSKNAHAAMYMGCDVKGLPMKLLGSINSANARISAMVLALDMDNSRLFAASFVLRRLPKGARRVG